MRVEASKMAKKTITILFLSILLALLFTACSSNEGELPQSDIKSSAVTEVTLDSFMGKSFSIELGTNYENVAHTVFGAGDGSIMYFSDIGFMEAVVLGKVDCTITDLTMTIPKLKQERFSSLAYFVIPDDVVFHQYAAISHDHEIINQFDQFLSTIVADGTFADMERRWVDDFDPNRPPALPDIPTTGENGTLRVAANSGCIPLVMLGAGGELIGLEVELILRFAASQGKTAVFTDMGYDALLPYVLSGKCDISVAAHLYGKERAESVFYTDTYYDARSAVIYRRADFEGGEPLGSTDSGGFVEWLKTGIQRNLITDGRWKMIVDGLGVTMTIAFFAQLFGTAFGCFVCFVLTRKNKFVKWLGNLYCGLIHGTPVVVVLMISYYIIFGSTSISNVLVAIAAFTMVMGANIAGTLKGAIDTVDPIEIEAARSIGFTALGAFIAVTLPQAVRRALPDYTKGFIELVKATAIVGYVAIQDLMRVADVIRSRTYDAYFPLLFVALIYLIITTICVQLFKLIVKKRVTNTRSR